MSWLQGMVSNDVGRLTPGRGCPAAHLSPQGKIVALVSVLADEDRLWILADRDPTRSLFEQLDRLLIMEDAALADESSHVTTWTLAGSDAGTVLESTLGSVPDSAYGHVVVGGTRILRTPLGFDLIVSVSESASLTSRLFEAGAAPGSGDAWERLAIERGVPRWGVDVDQTVTLPEIGEDAIDYEKGCYIGQEVVAKIRYIGHVNRTLRGLRIDGLRVPETGPITQGEREVGRLTSAVHSGRLGGVIGLGYLRRGFDAPGTRVEIRGQGDVQHAHVVELPFRITPSA